MKYLLDTCVISDFVRGEQATLRRVKSEQPNNVAISSVTWMELQYGLKLNPKRAKKIKAAITGLCESIHILPYEKMDGTFTASVRATLKTFGLPIGPYDIMIAGCALNHGLILVTSNTGEFERVAGLSLENWRAF